MIPSRRKIIRLLGFSGLGLASLPPLYSFSPSPKMLNRAIPSSGELLPVVGLGTWQSFDVSSNTTAMDPLKNVLKEMARLGGKVIDSSPMYGRSESMVGSLTQSLALQDHFFYATKVWTSGRDAGIAQMNTSAQKMKRKSLDLMQVHNLVDWQVHVKTLKSWKEEGKIRYWGLTHYVDSAHAQLEKIIRQENPDFVQFNYSIQSRNGEKSVLPTAQQYGTAVLINQPYESGQLFRKVKGKQLPAWAADYDITSWGQYFLKFILAHEAVNCVIPGTSDPEHLVDNMKAGYGILPDAAGREKMADYLRTL